MENLSKICLLDTHTPKAIVDLFKAEGDCTDKLCDLIRTVPHSALKKVKYVFQQVDNYGIEEVYELTQSKTRSVRYASTYLVLSKIKEMCKKKKGFSEIEEMYNSVFGIRYRDVDPHIRAMCIEFMTEWASENKVLCKLEYLKYVGWGLNDRSDLVRRKAVKCIGKIAKKAGAEFVLQYKDRLVEIAKKDISPALNREAISTIVNIFNSYSNNTTETKGKSKNQKNESKMKNGQLEPSIDGRLEKMDENIFIKDTDCNNGTAEESKDGAKRNKKSEKSLVFSEEEVLEVMALEKSTNTEFKKALEIICPDGIWNLDRIHWAHKISGPRVFKNLSLDDSETEAFVVNICEYLKANSSCCENRHLCFFDILKEIDLSIRPEYFRSLLETAKDNRENIQCLTSCISKITKLKEFPEQTKALILYLFGMVKDDSFCIEEFVSLLKTVEDGFDVLVLEILSKLKYKYTLPIIKKFEISDTITKDSKSIEKCYGSLWAMVKKDYGFVNSIELLDCSNFEELIEFLIFFYNQTRDFKEDVNVPFNDKKGITDKLTIQEESILNVPFNDKKGITDKLTIQNDNIEKIEEILENNFNNANIMKKEGTKENASFLEGNLLLNQSNGKLVKDENLFSNLIVADGKEKDFAFDPISAIKVMFRKLYLLISCNMDLFNSERPCSKLFELIELNLFPEQSSLIFQHCSLSLLLSLIDNCKNIKPFFIGYLKYISMEHTNSELYKISTRIASKLNKHDTDRFVFNTIKDLLIDQRLTNEVLVNFIPYISTNEAIVLESIAPLGKFKNLCLKKCKASTRGKPNVTFI